MTDRDRRYHDEPAGAPSPEGVSGDPGAAGPLDLDADSESGLAVGNTDAQAGAYGGVLDGGELAGSVDAGSLRESARPGGPATPGPERAATPPEEAGDRGEP